jgi:hypothetical protein
MRDLSADLTAAQVQRASFHGRTASARPSTKAAQLQSNGRWRTGVGGLAIAFATASLSGPAIAEPTYPVLDAGYRLARHGKLYWLDNERVLFYGGSAKQDSRGAGKAGSNPTAGGTYIWNIATGALGHVSEWEITCYHPEYSTWSLVRSAKNEFRFKAGKFGQESEPPREDLTVQQRMERMHSEITCRTYMRSELEPPPPSLRGLAILREGDGYLDLGPNLGANAAQWRGQPRNVVLYQSKTGNPIRLQMTWDENFSPSEVVYSVYRSAYVLRARKPRDLQGEKRRRWSKDFPPTIYLVWPDGRTEPISVPYLPAEFANHPRPVKAGWIFGGGNFYKASGLYLFDGKSVSKIDTGLVMNIAAAPDGCRAGVAIQNKHLEMGTPINLKVFDFCAGRR